MQLDMSLEKLLQYEGRNPCPPDMDEYWARALNEMEQTDPHVRMELADFQVPGYLCYDLYFNGVRNGLIHCRLIRPEKIDGKAPALLKFHGYSGYCGDWDSFLSHAALGYVVCAMDARGQGGYSQDKNPVAGNTYHGHIIRGLDDPDIDNLYFRQVFLDTAMTAKVVMDLEYVDETNVSAMGGSQGGALTVACASLVPTLKKAVFQYPFLCDYKRVWEMDLAERAYVELKEYFRAFDPMHKREDEIFRKLGYIDLQHLSSRIRAESLMFTGLMDSVCPPSTQFAMFNRIQAKKEYVIHYDYGHEGLRGWGDQAIQFLLAK